MIEPGNSLAIAMMLLWPVITLFIFRSANIDRAVFWSILGALLLLPASTTIKLPLFPDLEKGSLTAIVTFLVATVVAKNAGPILPKTPTIRFLLFVLMCSPILTVLNNQEPQIAAESFRPGLGFIDLASIIIGNLVNFLPFILGFRFLGTEKSHKVILQIMIVAGILYSLLILYEIRMSPRLHSIIYGYFPHDWRQQQRSGGFRSVAFLGHGLLVSIFLMAAVIAAGSFWKQKQPLKNVPPIIYMGYLYFVLIMNKSLAAVVYGTSALLLIRFFSSKMQLKVASAIVILCLVYPFLRNADLFPVDTLIGVAASYDENRAGSLAFRFDQEDILLARAGEKPMFGWGIWGRSRPINEFTGQGTAVTDGQWLLLLGEFGWAGYLAQFGLIGLPVLFAYRKSLQLGTNAMSTAGLGVIVAFMLLDQLPNASVTPWLWLVSGALLGYAEKETPKVVEVNETPENADQFRHL